ncbi:squalene--hopene cyclase [Acidithiobacillus sp. CV18-2]|uniref:Squalene--hopene cyclase n=1 Tax=Igneacidithiobacillus copahuensis TaxID=2724909 RepID=A0AAE2YS54_9PROT|nr:squalene--hopene cyclase [Igneacidithiobacillus copahuensis]MBU2754844.1 squalene--hopene cyclase [Acidithiobacillus sp. CV18-3]MBU2756758.1 squalene--hopene cyclase [Acidithiobacillus sp. BN09-2]MBU2777137.1 squalene--hopene cyclase [Acidithiobacillus sp. CV18-2]MBU2795629.1 squalene--hopene cyclase [Acidithiobacillus sp. VAN18-2]MBU2799040.1 squalene--hopene cyclase [Acidithiobacillus sp. VAN18-4]UTV81741.1 squalene--hopene cyclase [Acidithiobacillus sp. YTS05]
MLMPSARYGVARQLHAPLERAIAAARAALRRRQAEDGHWCFEFEADCTIPAEYILMMHYMDEIDVPLQRKIAVYLRRHQAEHGGWPLYYGGDFDMSASVKAYYALKLAGDAPEATHMRRARAAILAHGGAEHANVFTRITLALFRQVPWRAVPFIPVEILLFPRWFPMHIYKVASWSRTVMVPLFILCSLKAQAKNPTGIGIEELFREKPFAIRDYFVCARKGIVARVFLAGDRLGRALEPFIPGVLRRAAIRRAEAWFTARLNGVHGVNGIFPAMVNAHEALALLGYAEDHPYRQQTGQALRNLLVEGVHEAYCQPCVSPVWDTCWGLRALLEIAPEPDENALAAMRWLLDRQITDAPGDWQFSRPDLPGGGWAFQYENSYYPDLDDTAAVAWTLLLAGRTEDRPALERAADWLVGMQSRNGGFGAYDVDNTHYYLNEIPFADHKALLDPPTADVSGRVLTFLAALARPQDRPAIERLVHYLLAQQEANGSWFGRWGTNYIYGTWSVLLAFSELGDSALQPAMRRAADWLRSVQQADGGWGESNDSYLDPGLAGQGQASTAAHTAWACLALMAAGDSNSEALRRGIQWLQEQQSEDGEWHDPWFNAPGFPRVFYITYHGYKLYFPLWALSRYQNLQAGV